MRLAIFGGTFDPIHNAHLAIAAQAADHFSLSRVLFIPAAHPPHKAGVTHAPYQHRIRMVELACQGEPRFEASRLEEDTARSYSIDTIQRLRATIAADDELFFIIGADAFAEIHTWHRWQDVVRETAFIVISRPGHSYQAPANARVERLDSMELPVSSSEVRRALAAYEYPVPVPESVFQYILQNHLYLS